MGSDAKSKVLLFGAGSVGAVYLWLLSKVADTTAVCRSNYDIVSKEGFVINSAIFGQDIHFKPRVVRNCGEAASAIPNESYDYIVVCSKAIPGIEPKLIQPAVTPGKTAIVLIQNAIGIEQEYADAFPGTPIISTVVYLPATQRPSGVVKHGEMELLQLGAYPSSASKEPSQTFAQLVRAAGGTTELLDDVQTTRWSKLLINASWNPICALSFSKDTDVLASCSEATNVVEAVMMEIREVAEAYGHTIPKEKVAQQLGRAQARVLMNAGIEPSMLQDVQSGRRIEVEAIVGNVVTMARSKGLRQDRLELLYVLAKTLDLHIGRH
ncbi:hypothetical protein ACEQ8H_003619 [Pleosporales sp. CAS-2024a]